MAATDFLFLLVPDTLQALSIVEANPKFQLITPDRTKVLAFPFNFKSKYPGRLVSFGKAGCHDVILPSTHRVDNEDQEGYRNDHCFFYLAEGSGELVLRDVSGKTGLFYPNLPDPPENPYRLHGGPPHRQRVIPKGDARIDVMIGSKAQFRFQWPSNGKYGAQTSEKFLQRAKSLAVPGATITNPSVPASEVARQFSRKAQYQLPSQYTPSVKSTTACDITFHRYRCMGEGSFGVVHKVVDLRTGEIWALKEIKLINNGPHGSEFERRRAHERAESLKKEVETIFPLKHVSNSLISTIP
ncbi:hypothetical protein VPNG_06495 [Cytospora leucostoma]|uniref:Protein kinase domain-containing protein n=1 Tax=Cytospora leucostoma TaxID=1230097 RepID=A0A423X2A5_9PEZI|nr:hypothetical protein VPNG_06495 [Cytospora leucostoma]